MIHGDFSVLSPGDRATLLRRFHAALSQEGSVLLDVASVQQLAEADEGIQYEYSTDAGFWACGPHHVFSAKFKYDDEQLLCDKYVVFEPERELELLTWNQCYTRDSLREVFQLNGFEIAEWYGDVGGSRLETNSRRIAVAATRMD